MSVGLRAAAVVVPVALVAAVAGWWAWQHWEKFPLPERIVAEEPVADLSAARVEAEAAPAPAVEGHDPRLREKLRALGYVD